MRSKSREPGNQETKTAKKTKTNSNSRSARLFQMFPLLLLLNATNPASTTQTDFFAIFFIWCVTCTDQLGVGGPHPCPCPPPDIALLDHRSVVVQRDDPCYQIWEEWQADPPDPQICPCFLKVYNHRESEKGVSRICNLFLSYSCHVALLSAARQHSYIESIMYRCTLQHFHISNFLFLDATLTFCLKYEWIFLVIPTHPLFLCR